MQAEYLAVFWRTNFLVLSPRIVEVTALLKRQRRPISNMKYQTSETIKTYIDEHVKALLLLLMTV